MKDKIDISNRFIEALNELINRGILQDKKSFAESVGCSASMITEILKGRCNVGVSQLQNTARKYGISATWLLMGEGEMFVRDEAAQRNNGREENMVDKLLGIIDKKDNLIRHQSEDIGYLQEGTTLQERISSLINYYGNGKNTRFSELTGVGEASIRGYLKGILPKADFFEKVAINCEGISMDWLITGNGNMFVNEEPAQRNDDSQENMVDKLLGILDKKDHIIRLQAEDIGYLRSELEQLKQRLGKSAGAASTENYEG